MTVGTGDHTSRIADGRRRLEQGKRRLEQLLVWRIWERMLEVEFIDRSVALAAKAFVSFFPLLIVVAAFLPPDLRSSVFGTITRRLGMSGASLSMARGAFATSKQVRRATGVLGLLLTFLYVNSFTTALQRVYLRAWRRPPGGVMLGYVRGALWFAGVIGYMALLGVARDLLGSGAGIPVFFVVALGAAAALWLFTAHTMLRREVRLRVLLPGGLVTGILMSGFALSASVWMPNTLERNTRQFGIFGVALALVTWFSGAAICIVAGACAGPPLAEDTGSVGRWIRGATGTVLTPGAPPSLPAPVRPRRLVDAVRSNDDGN